MINTTVTLADLMTAKNMKEVEYVALRNRATLKKLHNFLVNNQDRRIQIKVILGDTIDYYVTDYSEWIANSVDIQIEMAFDTPFSFETCDKVLTICKEYKQQTAVWRRVFGLACKETQ